MFQLILTGVFYQILLLMFAQCDTYEEKNNFNKKQKQIQNVQIIRYEVTNGEIHAS